jgi:hypothetical protein
VAREAGTLPLDAPWAAVFEVGFVFEVPFVFEVLFTLVLAMSSSPD